ncbi:MAG: hypothetical protein FWE74_06505 [Oscillospiraceae bacterium]|nr:hypothetical protein [Oscillospiraceae bacterium]
MIYIYLAVTIISAALLITDVVLRYMERIKYFGVERSLFKLKGGTIPAEKFLPQTPAMALGGFLSLGTAGMIFEYIGFRWYFSLPFSVMTSMLICFALQYFLNSAVDEFKSRTLPKGDEAAGVQGFAYEYIYGDDYGLIEFEFNDIVFRAPAVSANSTMIPEFEKVIILFEEGGCFFVQSIKEVFDPLNNEEE